jgi:hypothetical protein
MRRDKFSAGTQAISSFSMIYTSAPLKNDKKLSLKRVTIISSSLKFQSACINTVSFNSKLIIHSVKTMSLNELQIKQSRNGIYVKHCPRFSAMDGLISLPYQKPTSA